MLPTFLLAFIDVFGIGGGSVTSSPDGIRRWTGSPDTVPARAHHAVTVQVRRRNSIPLCHIPSEDYGRDMRQTQNSSASPDARRCRLSTMRL
jgi:hypothetical protein